MRNERAFIQVTVYGDPQILLRFLVEDNMQDNYVRPEIRAYIERIQAGIEPLRFSRLTHIATHANNPSGKTLDLPPRKRKFQLNTSKDTLAHGDLFGDDEDIAPTRPVKLARDDVELFMKERPSITHLADAIDATIADDHVPEQTSNILVSQTMVQTKTTDIVPAKSLSFASILTPDQIADYQSKLKLPALDDPTLYGIETESWEKHIRWGNEPEHGLFLLKSIPLFYEM